MEQFNAIKQMVQFNKNAIDKGYNAMEMLREQNEKMTNSILEQASWMPEEGKKAVNEWVQLYKKGCDDFKKTVDQSYKNVENLFAGSGK
jgi:3-oxoacyl-ACP reductase-like protein